MKIKKKVVLFVLFFLSAHIFSQEYGIGFGGNDEYKSVRNYELKNIKNKDLDGEQAAEISGGRSRASIMRIVRQNMSALQYVYNDRLKEVPQLQEQIIVKWAIDEFGNVISCKSVGSTIDDKKFEDSVVEKIKRWTFGKIDIPNDVTEVKYPFAFEK